MGKEDGFDTKCGGFPRKRGDLQTRMIRGMKEMQ
jgi:hypothetical protein